MFPELSFGRVIEGCFGALGKAISDWQARSVGIAVGTPVARRPPHRSRRAVFPHRALHHHSLTHDSPGNGRPTDSFPSPVVRSSQACPSVQVSPSLLPLSSASARRIVAAAD